MKGESLYHLLQIRARKLEEGADADLQRQLQAVQAELRVSHSRGWFEVSWRHNGREFNLNVPEHDFTFYVAGDTGKAVEQRGTTGNVRQRNWQAAAALWQRLAAVSGFQIPRSSADGEMGLAPNGRPGFVSRNRQILMGIIAAVAGTVASGLLVDWTLALSAGLLAILLTLLMPAFDDTQLRRPFSLVEVGIVSGAVFPPLLAGANPLWLLPVAAGLVLVTWTEAVEGDLPAAWGLGGLLIGLATIALGIAGVLPGVLLCAGLTALRLLLPRRLVHTRPTWCSAGTVVGVLLGFAIPVSVGTADAYGTITPAVAAILVLAFAFWTFHGTLFRIMPWLTLGALGVTTAVAAFVPGASGDALSLSGFALIIGTRLVASFAGAVSGRNDKGTTTQ